MLSRNHDPPAVTVLVSVRRDGGENRFPAAMARILQRFDTRGMTRPARDPEERAWLAGRQVGEFVEDEACAEAALAYYARKYRR